MGTLQTRIRQLRKEHNFSQTQMAELLRKNYGLKTDRVMISKWETGFQTPEIYTISCIADLFNVSIDYLNGRDTNINSKKFPELNITDCTEKEILLLNNYKKLNNIGKMKAEAYIDDLLINEKYTRPAEERRLGTPSLEEAMEMQKQHSPLRTDRLGHDNIVHKAAFGGGVWKEKPQK